MVECECKNRTIKAASRKGFNRYMVECEYVTDLITDKTKQVLIDTWWNVNFNGKDH